MVLKACYVSNIGKVRRNNEDSLLINELLVSETSMDGIECLFPEGEKALLAVADGMGGHMKGEVASRTVLEAFRKRYSEIGEAGDIIDILRAAKGELDSVVRSDMQNLGLGTTISGMFVNGEKSIIFNCGDSRVYRIRGGRLEKMTRDHSVVQELVDSGVIGEEEMRSHPQKNIITSSIMGDLRTVLPEVYLQELVVGEGERFLICTDGVWEGMSGTEIEGCFASADISEISYFLFEKAFGYGRDNLSMIVMETSAMSR